jgi:hypothetical protein
MGTANTINLGFSLAFIFPLVTLFQPSSRALTQLIGQKGGITLLCGVSFLSTVAVIYIALDTELNPQIYFEGLS